MNAERLLQHYERIADAPDAIARLRRFILDLAVRGKLVPQDASDEPASELLKRIAKEKARLVKAGEIKQARHEPPDFGMTPNVLPSSWTWTAFGDVQELIRGVTYSKSDVGDGPGEGYVPILRANNIGVVLTHDEPVFVKRRCVSDEQFLRAGDFMIALSSGSKNLVGKAAFVPKDFREAFGGFCGVIRLINHDLQGFVRVFLQSDLYRESIAAGSRGIGINNLKKETLSNLFFPLPPLAEQHRIVAKVDELMGLCDRLEAARAGREATRDRLAAASLARLNAPDPETFVDDARFALNALPALTTRPDQIKRLRQTILNLAVRGKLVAQDTNDEPASELLVSLRAGGKKPRSEKLAPDDIGMPTAGVPFDCPNGWVWTKVQNVLEGNREISYGVIKLGDEPRSGGVPTLRCSDVRPGYIDLSSVRKVQEAIEAEYARTRLVGGEIVINIRGTLGGVALVPIDLSGFNVAREVSVVPISQRIPGQFMVYLMLSPYFWDHIQNNLRGIAYKGLNLGILRDLPIPLPPLAEQHRIVAKVDALMALCDRLEASLTATADTRRNLLDALLAEALAPVIELGPSPPQPASRRH